MTHTLKLLAAVLGVLLFSGAQADSPERLVVSIGGADSDFAITVGPSKPADLLLALSEMHAEKPDRPVLLLVHEDTPIAKIANVLGIMSKAQMPKPRIFSYTSHRDTMVEISWGCEFLYPSAHSELTLAHGAKTCL
jgi:hypothetical protein